MNTESWVLERSVTQQECKKKKKRFRSSLFVARFCDFF